jgi:hypothetical protein
MVFLIAIITALPTAYLIFRDFYLKNIDHNTRADKKYVVLFSMFVLFLYFAARRTVSIFNEPYFIYALGFRPPYLSLLLLLLNSFIEYGAWLYVRKHAPKKQRYSAEPLFAMVGLEFQIYMVVFIVYVFLKIFVLEPFGIMSPYYHY